MLLVFAILNTTTAKSFHEMLKHTEVVDVCCDEHADHFHKHDIHHQDVICGFSFSANDLVRTVFATTNFIAYKTNLVSVYFLWIVDSLYYSSLLLRGPPSVK